MGYAVAGSLIAENLFKGFKNRLVVNDVNLTVNTGEIVGLLGPNGAGKSTTFYMMVGRIMPDSGRVLIEGADVTAMPMYLRARRGIGYLPQEASIFRRLSVHDNLRLVLHANGLDKHETEIECERLIDELGLVHITTAPGYALSGGERRRVEIARCLAMKPSFILLDEPFSGIDPVAVYDIQEIVAELCGKGYGILLTDHNVRETLAITNRTYLMHRGSVVLEGPLEKIANDPIAKKYYLGERFEW
ncbi:MAG: LPS export ABC transporter ATP-binding protein [Synergistaceae bacterium]|jgi:lipopolysaccharide export system ATP-binding protein|nr:LPS export ABC transporter ATP-binding protein [Synergistaceae bacterium]